MSTYIELSQDLEKLLRLKISPLGFKFFARLGDIPKGFEMMDTVCTLCQVIGIARYHEKAVATTKDAATACGMGGVSLGFYPTPEDVADGSRNAGVWAGTIEATRKIVEDRTCVKTGQFEAVGIAPLKLMPVEPDVVQVWGSPVQMLSLVYAQIWDGGNPVELKTNGHGASCNEALTIPYLTGEPRLALADIGDRRFAYAADDEMIMGIPFSRLQKLVENLKASYKGAYKYPYAYYFHPIAPGALQRCSADSPKPK